MATAVGDEKTPEERKLIMSWFDYLTKEDNIANLNIKEFAGNQMLLNDLPNPKSPSGNCAVHYAAIYDQPTILEKLMENMACDMEKKNKLGSTALHLACAAGSAKAVEVLVTYTKDFDLANGLGNTYLHCAVLSGSLDTFLELVNGLEEKPSFKLRAALKVSNFAGMTSGGYARSFDPICKWLEDKFQIKSVEEEFE